MVRGGLFRVTRACGSGVGGALHSPGVSAPTPSTRFPRNTLNPKLKGALAESSAKQARRSLPHQYRLVRRDCLDLIMFGPLVKQGAFYHPWG